MDDFLKRLVIGCMALTAAFWFLSWGMLGNGAAFPKNPAWVLISNLHDVFT